VALLGLIAYVVLLASSLSGGERALLIGFGVSLVGFGFSAYLTYREVFTIHAICSWCVSSAILLTLLAAVSSVRVLRRRPSAGAAAGAGATDAIYFTGGEVDGFTSARSGAEAAPR
jgi:uncharacterized membrane protein